MLLKRRNFIKTAGLASVAGFLPGMISCDSANEKGEAAPGSSPSTSANWESVRQSFLLDREIIHMAGLLLASNPQPVRDAVSEHRQNLDKNPAAYVQENFSDMPARV